jgi:hypothetical protein
MPSYTQNDQNSSNLKIHNFKEIVRNPNSKHPNPTGESDQTKAKSWPTFSRDIHMITPNFKPS